MPDASQATRVLCVLLLTLLLTIVLAAAAGLQLDLDRWTVDGGGGTSRGGSYVLSGTAGQAEAGSQLSGAPYALSGGFWSAPSQQDTFVYLPLVLRAYP
jgi:hypothetical protein